MKYKLAIILTILCSMTLKAQSYSAANTEANAPKMEWWKNAKFGMFIHWGLYAVPGGIWNGKTDYGEWIMNEAKISRAEYSALSKEFNPTKFNAEEWVKLAKAAGQKYIVITSKHHEGFAMFKSDATSYNIYDATPFKRDVIDEMAKACRKYGMKLGLYYSQAQDWYHPGGATTGEWDETHKGDMDKYIDEIAIPQVKEILSKYGDIAILWWDTPKDMNKERAKKLHAFRSGHAQIPSRRASAVLECPPRRHVARRSATGTQILYRSDCQACALLLSASQCTSGHHFARNGEVRLCRQCRSDDRTSRIRYSLLREHVVGARSDHFNIYGEYSSNRERYLVE